MSDAKLPHIKIHRKGSDEIEVLVNDQKVDGVIGVSLGMSQEGSFATIVLIADKITLNAELHRLLLAGTDEKELGEAS